MEDEEFERRLDNWRQGTPMVMSPELATELVRRYELGAADTARLDLGEAHALEPEKVGGNSWAIYGEDWDRLGDNLRDVYDMAAKAIAGDGG